MQTLATISESRMILGLFRQTWTAESFQTCTRLRNCQQLQETGSVLLHDVGWNAFVLLWELLESLECVSGTSLWRVISFQRSLINEACSFLPDHVCRTLYIHPNFIDSFFSDRLLSSLSRAIATRITAEIRRERERKRRGRGCGNCFCFWSTNLANSLTPVHGWKLKKRRLSFNKEPVFVNPSVA